MLILGMSSAITPIPVDNNGVINLIVVIGVTALVFVPCLIKKGMGRIVGGLSVLGYVGYTAYLLMTTVLHKIKT